MYAPKGEGRQGSVGQAGQVPARGGDQEGKRHEGHVLEESHHWQPLSHPLINYGKRIAKLSLLDPTTLLQLQITWPNSSSLPPGMSWFCIYMVLK